MVDKPVAIIKAAPEPRHMTRIVLADNPNIPPTGQYFGHNGNGFIIRAGEEVDVPDEIIAILDDAIELVAHTDASQKLTGATTKRRRFAYHRV
jgi:hypothetical protein